MTRILYSLFTVLLLAGTDISSRAQKNNLPDHIHVNGKIKHGKKAVKGAFVKLYKDNKLEMVMRTRYFGGYALKLEVNQNYIIEFEHKGMSSKKVVFNTHMPAQGNALKTAAYGIDVDLETNTANVENKLLDLPVSIITYDRDLEVFRNSFDYTQQIKNIRERLHTAMLATN